MDETNGTSLSNVTSPACHGNGTCNVTETDQLQKLTLSPFGEMVTRVAYIVIGTVGLLDNLLVIIIIFNYTTMRKKMTNIFIINQSIIDAMASFFIIMLGVVEVDGQDMTSGNIRDEFVCNFWLTRVSLWSMLLSSTYNLVCLTFERYLEIVHPVYHKMNFSQTKAVIAMVCVWICGPVYNLAYLLPTSNIIDGVCYPFAIWPSIVTQRVVAVLTISVHYLFPICCMVYCYATMAISLRTRIHPTAPTDNTIVRARKNVMRTLAIVSLTFVLCWTSNQVVFCMHFLGYPTDFGSAWYHFTVVAVLSNSCLNPFVYIAKYRQFQVGAKQFMCGLFKKYRPTVAVQTDGAQ